MTTPAQPDTGTAGAAPDTGTAPETGTTTQDAATATETVDWQAEAEKYKALARKHEQRAKTNKQALDDLQAKAAPAEGEEDWKTKAEEAAARAEAAEVRAVELAYETTVNRIARDVGADAEALLDSQAFRDAVADELDDDFDDDDLRAAVGKVAKEFARQPRFSATPTGPTRSGTEMNGATGGPRQITEAELARMTPEQIVAAQENGQLNALLGRT